MRTVSIKNQCLCLRKAIYRVGNIEVRSAMPRILRRTRLLIDTALKEQHVDTHIRSLLAAAAFCWSRGAAPSFFAIYMIDERILTSIVKILMCSSEKVFSIPF